VREARSAAHVHRSAKPCACRRRLNRHTAHIDAFEMPILLASTAAHFLLALGQSASSSIQRQRGRDNATVLKIRARRVASMRRQCREGAWIDALFIRLIAVRTHYLSFPPSNDSGRDVFRSKLTTNTVSFLLLLSLLPSPFHMVAETEQRSKQTKGIDGG